MCILFGLGCTEFLTEEYIQILTHLFGQKISRILIVAEIAMTGDVVLKLWSMNLKFGYEF